MVLVAVAVAIMLLPQIQEGQVILHQHLQHKVLVVVILLADNLIITIAAVGAAVAHLRLVQRVQQWMDQLYAMLVVPVEMVYKMITVPALMFIMLAAAEEA